MRSGKLVAKASESPKSAAIERLATDLAMNAALIPDRAELDGSKTKQCSRRATGFAGGRSRANERTAT